MTRRRVHEILERSKVSDRTGRLVDAFLILLIIANVLAAILETVPEIAEGRTTFFIWLELISVAIFTVEYGLRLWSCVEAEAYRGLPPWRARWRYMRSWAALVDLAAIAPFYLTVFFDLDLRFLRILRLLRVFKLSRYSSAFIMLGDVVRREGSTLTVSFVVLAVLLVVTASGAYLVERHAQPEAFGSIPAAMWWAVATLTTVGYGDVTPVTPLGQIFGGVVSVIGIGIAAVPAGILASGFSAELAQRRVELKKQYLKALTDGEIGEDEAAKLEVLRRDLGLSRADAEEVLERARMIRTADRICPHCGGDLSKHLL